MEAARAKVWEEFEKRPEWVEARKRLDDVQQELSKATEAWGGAGATWVRLRSGKKALGPGDGCRITPP